MLKKQNTVTSKRMHSTSPRKNDRFAASFKNSNGATFNIQPQHAAAVLPSLSFENSLGAADINSNIRLPDIAPNGGSGNPNQSFYMT
jgi:hypothetical protein